MQFMGLWGSSGLQQTVTYHITEDFTLLSIFMLFILFNYAVACGRDSQVLLPVLRTSGSGMGGQGLDSSGSG
jgi:hypothetical protein